MPRKATTNLSEFKIAETKTFEKRIQKLSPKLYEKVKTVVYPQLRRNPFFGPGTKKLKGPPEPYYRYRFGNHRLFYLIENDKVLVIAVDIRHRQEAYG